MAVTVDAAVFDESFPNLTAAQKVTLRTLATRLIEDYAPDAPDEVATEAAIRCGAYIVQTRAAGGAVDRISAGSVDLRFRVPGSPLRRSGAMALLSPYRTRRALGAAS